MRKKDGIKLILRDNKHIGKSQKIGENGDEKNFCFCYLPVNVPESHLSFQKL